MRVLRFIWSGVLAFDRIGTRIPQLVQLWLIELFVAVPLMFFIAEIIDIRGAFGVPGTGAPFDNVLWGCLAVSIVFGFFWLRGIVKPKVKQGSWTPMVSADLGDVTVYGANRSWTVHYDYLTSHPSYSLLLLITAPIPVVMVWMTENQGDNSFYFRVAGIVGIVILAVMAMIRLVTWYVLRLGRGQIDADAAKANVSQAKLGWEMAWKPVLMLMVMIYAIGGIPIAYMWWDELRTIDKLQVVSIADGTDAVDQYRRVEGEINGDPVYWAPRGTGRGGNNYPGAGVLVDIPSGGEALLLAESLSVPDFKGVMRDVRNGDIKTHGRVIEYITENQEEYYGFDEADFPDPSPDGRVLVLLEYP
jgi:hypothetical protein